MMLDILKDVWLLFGRLFPFPTSPGLRAVGAPDASSPVLVTGNFELTVRTVTNTLKEHDLNAWLLVAPTNGINVWCAGGAGEFTADTVISAIKTSGIEERVDHRRLILPQLSANGVNIWALKERTGWDPRFGPADIEHLPEYLASGERRTKREHRHVEFPLKDRFVMGTNLGFNVALLLILPLLLGSIWVNNLALTSLPLIFLLSVLSSVLVFWLPGKVGAQKGLSLGLLIAAPLVVLSQTAWTLGAWETVGWLAWLLLLAAFVGYDFPSWSPHWRQDPRELILGKKTTSVEVVAEKCIGCHLCDVVCPADVFGFVPETRKYEVVNLAACQACGACIENCPTDAIVNNFRAGDCACPTCYVIAKVKRTPEAKDSEEQVVSDTETVSPPR